MKNQRTSIEELPGSLKAFGFFLGLWLVINLLQAFFTGIGFDEAYYWMYGRHLDWAYFDHPPATPLLIRFGEFFLQHELGTRLFFVLGNGLAFYLLWEVSNRPKPWVFWLVIGATFGANVAGFLAVPDGPLLISAAVYLFCLRNYLKQDSLKWTLIMALSVAFILYSKYHGILLFLLTLAAVPKIFKRPSFYAVLGISLLLYLPHLWWQYTHDFPTVHYYLEGRPSETYAITNTTDYLLGSLALAGPLMGLLTIFLAVRTKPENDLDRVLKFVLIGVFGFFFLFSFRGRPESNWVALSLIPLIILGSRQISKHAKWQKTALWLGVPGILIIFFFRINMAFHLFPAVESRLDEYRHWDQVVEDIKTITGEDEIVANTYQVASKLGYTMRKDIPSLNIGGRENQYTIWNLEAKLQGKPTWMVGGYSLDSTYMVQIPGGKPISLRYTPCFNSMAGVSLIPILPKVKFSPGEQIQITVMINCEDLARSECDKKLWKEASIHVHYFRQESMYTNTIGYSLTSKPFSTGSRKINSNNSLEPGEYELELKLDSKNIIQPVFSERISLTVE